MKHFLFILVMLIPVMTLAQPAETQTPEELATKYVRSTKTQNRVKVVGVSTEQDAQLINAGSLGNIVEVQELPANAVCNVLIVGPEKEIEEGELGGKKRKVPVVSDEKLNELWGKKGNSWPVKLSGVIHPLPEFYWNILLKGEACKLAADEPDYYLASDWKQLIVLPDNIKQAVITVSVVVDEAGKDVQKTFFWGDPEIANAKEVLYLQFPHQWAGRENDLGIIDPALLEYRNNNK